MEQTESTRGGLASLRLRTDASLLASLYPERAEPVPPSRSLLVSLSLFYLSNLSPSIVPSLSSAHRPAARFCLTSVPLFQLFFPTDCSPVQAPMFSVCLTAFLSLSLSLTLHDPSLLRSSILLSRLASRSLSSFVLSHRSLALCHRRRRCCRRLLLLFLSPSSDSACIPVSGSLSVPVKRHPQQRASVLLQTNLDLSSLGLSAFFFPSSSPTLSTLGGGSLGSVSLSFSFPTYILALRAMTPSRVSSLCCCCCHCDHVAPALKSLALFPTSAFAPTHTSHASKCISVIVRECCGACTRWCLVRVVFRLSQLIRRSFPSFSRLSVRPCFLNVLRPRAPSVRKKDTTRGAAEQQNTRIIIIPMGKRNSETV